MKYVDLVIDNKSDSTDILYTYGCEDDSVCVPGSKVYVPFARSRNRRLHDAYVAAVSDRAPARIWAQSSGTCRQQWIADVSLTDEMVRDGTVDEAEISLQIY